MREKVEAILGYKIPSKLDWILERLIVQGKSADEIAEVIRKNMYDL